MEPCQPWREVRPKRKTKAPAEIASGGDEPTPVAEGEKKRRGYAQRNVCGWGKSEYNLIYSASPGVVKKVGRALKKIMARREACRGVGPGDPYWLVQNGVGKKVAEYY